MSGKNFKVILIGNLNVGKTTIINRFVNEEYCSEYKPTIGIDIFQKDVIIDGISYSLTIWDTAGSEKYQSVVKSYYRGTDLLFLVFDVTNETSFTDLNKWWEEYKSNDAQYTECIVNVIANKIDLKSSRVVTEERAKEYADLNNWNYFETSAQENIGIVDCFKEITNLGSFLKQSYPQPPPIDDVSIILTSPSAPSSDRKCCLYN